MKQNNVDATKAVDLAKKIVALLVKETSDVRRRAIDAALVLLGDGETSPFLSKQGVQDGENVGGAGPDLETFFSRDEALKPSDHAQLCAAYHYSAYGSVSFSLEELRAIAGDAGVILPDRLDKTLVMATKNGRKLFQSAGKGAFKPTAAAGLVFKERWGVKPGRRMKTEGSKQE